MESLLQHAQFQDDLRHIPIGLIIVNQYQPRKDFHEEDLDALAQSIRAVGILQPLLVRPIPHSDCYELISGERRLRAAQMALLATVPAYIRQTDDSVSAQAALIENVQRVDLNPLEISKALKLLMVEFGFSQDQLSARIGKKRSTISNYLRLLALPLSIQESISKEYVTMGHAKAILSLNTADKQHLLHELILRDRLSVREAETAAQRIGEKAKKQKLAYEHRDFYLDELAGKIRERLGTQVVIQSKGKRGRISIDYYNYDDLDRILALLGVGHQL